MCDPLLKLQTALLMILPVGSLLHIVSPSSLYTYSPTCLLTDAVSNTYFELSSFWKVRLLGSNTIAERAFMVTR